MINKNIMNRLSDNSQIRSSNRYDSYNLGREYDLIDIKDQKQKKGRMFEQDKIEFLNDRDLFGKVSNTMDDIEEYLFNK